MIQTIWCIIDDRYFTLVVFVLDLIITDNTWHPLSLVLPAIANHVLLHYMQWIIYSMHLISHYTRWLVAMIYLKWNIFWKMITVISIQIFYEFWINNCPLTRTFCWRTLNHILSELYEKALSIAYGNYFSYFENTTLLQFYHQNTSKRVT